MNKDEAGRECLQFLQKDPLKMELGESRSSSHGCGRPCSTAGKNNTAGKHLLSFVNGSRSIKYQMNPPTLIQTPEFSLLHYRVLDGDQQHRRGDRPDGAWMDFVLDEGDEPRQQEPPHDRAEPPRLV